MPDTHVERRGKKVDLPDFIFKGDDYFHQQANFKFVMTQQKKRFMHWDMLSYIILCTFYDYPFYQYNYIMKFQDALAFLRISS